jgi:hypothetical protein
MIFSVPEDKGNIEKEGIPQNQFQNCFGGWTRRWLRCMASQGEYFEGDDSDIQQ